MFVGNDVQVATDAEFKLGAGKPYKSLLGVFWGTGVGGGLILNRKPWLGQGGAGEIGHMVVEIDGARCPCGRRGCMEAYAGRAAMESRARKRAEKGQKTDLFTLMKEHERTRLTSAIWCHALERKDKVATEIIDEAVRALGAGVASAVNLLDVEAVDDRWRPRSALRAAVRGPDRKARCIRTCSTTEARRTFGSRRWVTSAARSGRRCWFQAGRAQEPHNGSCWKPQSKSERMGPRAEA